MMGEGDVLDGMDREGPSEEGTRMRETGRRADTNEMDD